MKKALTSNQNEAISQAAKTVSNIDFLLGRVEFQEFFARFQRRSDELADRILHEDMPPDQREGLRQLRLGIREVLLSPEEDKTTNLNTLSQYGITPGRSGADMD